MTKETERHVIQFENEEYDFSVFFGRNLTFNFVKNASGIAKTKKLVLIIKLMIL